MPEDYKPLVRQEQIEDVTRVEVIDHFSGEGRAFVKIDPRMMIELELQDNGTTLKIFLISRKSNRK